MKVVWLCNYSLYYLKDHLDIKAEPSKFHPTTWIHYLIREIEKHPEIDLHIVTATPYVERDTSIRIGNCTYHIARSGIPFLNKGFPSYFRADVMTSYFFLRRKLRRILRRIDPDIVTAHGTEDVYGLAALDHPAPSVVWIQGLISSLVQNNNDAWLKRQLEFERKVFATARNFISNCDNFDYLITDRNPGASISYLSYPIAHDAFEIGGREQDADIAFAGSVIKRKGIEDLIHAVRIVAKDMPGIRVKVIGGHASHEYMEYLNGMIRDFGLVSNFRFMGFLKEHRDVLAEIASSGIFVLPTHMDTGPRVVAESMALGVPVISYNIDGLPWMIADGERGILVEKENIGELAAAMLSLLQNGKKRSAVVEQARKFARDNFYAPLIVKNLLELYNRILLTNKS